MGKWSCRRGDPDEFYVHKPTLSANRPAFVRRTMGSKKSHGLRAYRVAGKQVKIEDVPQEQRDTLADQLVSAGTGKTGRTN
ncbi:hypothetical protein ACNKHL_09015 [Shigella flexneri]